MLDISKLISISESAGAAVQIQEPVIECPEEYKNLSMSESSLYFDNQMLRCELEYRDIMDESVNDMIQDMINQRNSIVNEAAIIDRAKQLVQRVWGIIKRIAKAVAKFFANIAKRCKDLFMRGKSVNEKASKAIDDANDKYNSKDKNDNSVKNESAADDYHKNHEERMKVLNKKIDELNDDRKKDDEYREKQRDNGARLRALLGESTSDFDFINEDSGFNEEELSDSHELINSVSIDDDYINISLKSLKYNYLPVNKMKAISDRIYAILGDYTDLDKLIEKYSNEDEITSDCSRKIYKIIQPLIKDEDSNDDYDDMIKGIKYCEIEDEYEGSITFRYGRTRFNDIVKTIDDAYGDGWHYDNGPAFAKYGEERAKQCEAFENNYHDRVISALEQRLYEIINSDKPDKYKADAMRFYVVVPKIYDMVWSATYAIYQGEVQYYNYMVTLAAKFSSIYCKVMHSKI